MDKNALISKRKEMLQLRAQAIADLQDTEKRRELQHNNLCAIEGAIQLCDELIKEGDADAGHSD